MHQLSFLTLLHKRELFTPACSHFLIIGLRIGHKTQMKQQELDHCKMIYAEVGAEPEPGMQKQIN